ncbi:MAG TPA: lipid IV(A) 3-deoxy-D-manno-octulosonic acid transferase [Thermomonas sp.]|jgi:3-deoxy-D-manno-octulosonic-acid transferase|uniref:lipid IV(A) 3-deoxy-D-manno-octulosonic acid transferase n=1 Tax=Thermomonas sp. TaxID=1971895 RepID=UPI002C33354E|nr:lipid IV(A) 3-deoxy-D-manno-octulosonic acid transferase [Thermomonas sp.]HOV96410.1 lipid IV(A) 3-deoxy-D-manno-octulosonic acid transferase [Thermomonas sp.]
MQTDFTERVLRGVYSAALYLLLPITLYHLIWRGFRQRAYFQRWDERYASYADGAAQAPLWLHAVSVGEVNLAAPLVAQLRAQRPDLQLVVTTITPTGSARARALWGDSVAHVYLPYDLPGAVGRFLTHFRPALALIVETELWPNLLFACRDRNIPTHILNARLSARSLRGYRVLGPLIRRALSSVALVAAQSNDDARRFLELGALPERVQVTGNLKFDMAPVQTCQVETAFAAALGAARPVWIAASTHEEEEAAVLEAHLTLLRSHPDALLLWAPRHPERFRAVAQRASDIGLVVATRSQQQWPQTSTGVFVIDTLGELLNFYACAQVAFVGGSLQDIGGHNLLEPAATGTAILTGPHLHNFADIARRLREAQAMRMVTDAASLARALCELFDDADVRQALAQHAAQLLQEGRGALARTLTLIAPKLPPAAGI